MKSAAPILRWLAVAAAATVAAGCGQRAATRPADRAEAEAARAGYMAPPRVERATATGGLLVLEGSAPSGARIRISEAAGAYGGTAEANGRWRVEAPARSGARLFTVTAEFGQRVLEAEGRLVVLPDQRALLLRPGYGALPVGEVRGTRPAITSVDVGPDGAAAVSGVAAPRETVVTRIDGVAPPSGTAVGSGAADAAGRFAVILARPLPPGAHLVEVATAAGGATGTRVEVAPADAPPQPFFAVETDGGWRLVWRAPGGGLQTTYVPAERS